jgi:hypothetical protein
MPEQRQFPPLAANIAKLPELLATKRATRRVTYYDPLRERRG